MTSAIYERPVHMFNDKFVSIIAFSAFSVSMLISVKALIDVSDVADIVEFGNYEFQDKTADLLDTNERLSYEVSNLKEEVEYLQSELESTQDELRILSKKVTSLEIMSTLR